MKSINDDLMITQLCFAKQCKSIQKQQKQSQESLACSPRVAQLLIEAISELVLLFPATKIAQI